MTYGYSSFALGETQGCAGFNPETSKYHLINIAVIKAFGTGLLDDIKASSIFDEEIHFKIPKLEFFYHRYKNTVAAFNETQLKLSKIVEASPRHQKIFETLSDPILYDSHQMPHPGFDWNLFLSIAAIAMVIFVAVVGVITFLRRDKRSRTKQKEIEMEIGI